MNTAGLGPVHLFPGHAVALSVKRVATSVVGAWRHLGYGVPELPPDYN
jgi:hypothetical protein